jgi:hypothetical protein
MSLSVTSTLVYYVHKWLDPTRVEPPMRLHFYGRLRALPANIISEVEVTDSENTLAYFDWEMNITVKGLIKCTGI